MPIKIPNELPARATLEAEGIMLMREADAVRQDIRPMRIGLLNLMPNKIRTETQFARLLGSTPLQVELTLVKMTNHIARNTPSDHIISFYRDFEDVRSEKFDGFIVTGAPVETMPFEEVTYWDELCEVSTGRSPTCIRPSTSVGAPRRPCITSMVCRSIHFRRKHSASSAIAIWRRPLLICAASRM